MTKNSSSKSNATTPLFTGVAGFAAGIILCWFTMVTPMFSIVEEREASLKEWESINRQERQAIADIKTISTEELRNWVSTLETQNSQHAKLISRLHEQELQLVNPSSIHLWISAIVILGVAGFGVWMVRDTNADAARTLHNAVAVLPSLDEALRDNELMIESKDQAIEKNLNLETSDVVNITEIKHGKIIKFLKPKAYGFISDMDGNEIFFHKKALEKNGVTDDELEGKTVAYRVGSDFSGRSCAVDITFESDIS